MIGGDFQPRLAYRVLRLIFYALNTGLLIFFMVGVYLNGMQIPSFKDEIDILTLVNILLLAAIPVGYTISGRKMESIDPADAFAKKFEQYQTAMIIRWAMIEGTALFSIVGLILLQDAKQLVLFVLCILVLSVNTVTREKVIRGAKLNKEEAKALWD
jgi:F0F1-type ATP synthase membrane subunit c/vacuolar-type H+-ATPase subunit K